MIKSPYNFVPAPTESEVYKPDWADLISHDVPFEDGESGEIAVTITAETPIFIRNGHAKPGEGEQVTSEFSHVEVNGDKKYFIPATSIKGMLRNVLEIMSFSRMKQINNDHHAIRQTIKNKEDVMDEGYELSSQKENISCGYLIQKGNDFFIYSCGTPLKIRYTDLDKIFNNGFSDNFSSSVSTNFDERTGAYKYENIINIDSKAKDVEVLFKNKLEHEFQIHPLDEDEKQKSWVSKFQPLNYAKINEDSDDVFYGRIVCVGQATAYKEKEARKGEYVFRGKKDEVLKDKKVEIKVLKEQMETFLFINRDGKSESEELKDWTFWKNHLKNGIPVFFRMSGKNLIDFGLTFMYKQPVKYHVADLLPNKPENGIDLAECIFGTIQKGFESKGRVFISHFKAVGEINPMDEQPNILSSPKSSYTPFYITQHSQSDKVVSYNTYNVGNPSLRGFKRYAVHSETKPQIIDLSKNKLISNSKPLPKGSTFVGVIRFHNLKKIEIGALISTLKLHGVNNAYHNIGGIKPFGYGRISVKIQTTYDCESYMKVFETRMRVQNQVLWSERMTELIAMATIISDESKLNYMDLADFQLVKSKGYYLKNYSIITGFNKTIPSYATSSDIENLKKEDKEKEDKINQILSDANSYLENDEFEKSIEFYKKYSNLKKDFDIEAVLSEVEKNKKLYDEFQILISCNEPQMIETKISNFTNTKWFQLLKSERDRILNERKNNKLNEIINQDMDLDTSSFIKIKEVLNKRISKKIVFSENQIHKIIESLKINYQIELDDKKSEWRKNNFPKYPWSDIIKWLGQEKAQNLYNDLNP
ncbi:MAG: TIGR03986 family CRISPR-associated RAMP protein [Spirosomataceae bacterium]